MSTTPSFNPEATRLAAERFVAMDEEEEFDVDLGARLIGTFGAIRQDTEAMRRAAWLCIAAVRRYSGAWSALGCEGLGPEPALDVAADWVRTGKFSEGFAGLCLPVPAIRDGERVADCDAPSVEQLAAAAARTAYFCRTRNVIDGALVLCDLRGAALEGLQASDEIEFEDWLSGVGIDVAWELRGIKPDASAWRMPAPDDCG